jgi:uncharacterized membrane protein
MKIFGHPVHIILIHFPSALLPMDFACSLIAYFGGPASLTDAAFYAAAGGVILGWLAVITGSIDLLPLVKKKPGSLNKALIHGTVNTTVLLAFTVMAIISYKNFPALVPDGAVKLWVKGILVLVLGVGNFLGGSLILKDKIAVEN